MATLPFSIQSLRKRTCCQVGAPHLAPSPPRPTLRIRPKQRGPEGEGAGTRGRTPGGLRDETRRGEPSTGFCSLQDHAAARPSRRAWWVEKTQSWVAGPGREACASGAATSAEPACSAAAGRSPLPTASSRECSAQGGKGAGRELYSSPYRIFFQNFVIPLWVGCPFCFSITNGITGSHPRSTLSRCGSLVWGEGIAPGGQPALPSVPHARPHLSGVEGSVPVS